MKHIHAASLDELLAVLVGIEDDVPPRGPGRRTEHTEPWVMKRLVASLASAGVLEFPLAVEMNDRPDLRVKSDGREIGIELMELVPPAYAHAVAIANSEFPGAIVDRSVFRWGTNWESEEIREHLQCEGHRLSGPGWAGDSVEREWVNAVRGAIKKKTERLNADGFNRLPENWLGTYSSSPGPVFDAKVAATMVCPGDLHVPEWSVNFGCAANLVSDSVIAIYPSGMVTCPHYRFP